MKIIVGLGNPGEKYAKVRHNLGFMVLDEMVKDWEESAKFKSKVAKLGDFIFAKPQTYMNNSGMAVKLLTDYFKIPAQDLIIIHDDMDLSLGKIKIRLGGSAAGHHGVESIIKDLGTDQFIRVRLGIEPSEVYIRQPEKFVLEPFIPKEKPEVKHMIKQAVKALEILLEKGLNSAQSQFN